MTATLRAATPADTDAICALLAASYHANPKADPQVLRWQYWDNPFGPARSWLLEIGGEVACHWAAIPVPVHLGGREVIAAKGVDIATHPAHRRRGLFTRVARALLDDCRDAGVEVLLSHPNPASAGPVGRAGAVTVGCARAYVRPLDASWLARRLRLPRPGAWLACRLAFPERTVGGEQVPAMPAPPEGLDALWDRLRAGQPSGIVRDAAWWRWRYAQRPGGDYRYLAARQGGTLTAAAVLALDERHGGRFALVCELLAGDETAARALGRGLTAAARAAGAVGVAAITLPGTKQAALLTAAGLRPLPRRLEPRRLRVMVAAPAAAAPGGRPAPDAAALARRDWTVSWGDLDHL